MSKGLDRLDQHPAGYWAYAAAVLAEDIRMLISVWPVSVEFDWMAYRSMKYFFGEIEEALKGATGKCQASYRLGLRALGCCYDHPITMVEGKRVGILTLEEANFHLADLIKLFSRRVAESDESAESEWGRLADFLERVKCLDDADRSDLEEGSTVRPYFRLH